LLGDRGIDGRRRRGIALEALVDLGDMVRDRGADVVLIVSRDRVAAVVDAALDDGDVERMALGSKWRASSVGFCCSMSSPGSGSASAIFVVPGGVGSERRRSGARSSSCTLSTTSGASFARVWVV
jgi:hypothetical protein